MWATADLCDELGTRARVVDPIFRCFGGKTGFQGSIETVRVFEDNILVRQALQEEGRGRVLVVDGGGSKRCALLGDRVATLALENGWAGVVIYGCIRDSAEVAEIPVGVFALATHPRKSRKIGAGERGVPVKFGGVTFNPGEFVVVDEDGIVVAETAPE